MRRLISTSTANGGSATVRLEGSDFVMGFRQVPLPVSASSVLASYSVDIDSRFPLSEGAEAHRRSEGGHLRGKIVPGP
ncbi:zinc-binding dehydrogenase [Nocardioides jensenii]|uniref:zinc-binding dehydrogenase n=1 Tax=Nocardioides jensenii TaxID=1843 RepID=UPI000834E09B|nr:zinc-binding dehydrogenase [Nocardioides jensenii]